eukprot:EG_transcript_52586
MSAYAWRAADGAPIPLDHPRWLAREAWRPPLAALLRQLRSLRALPAAERRYAWHSLTDRVVAPDCGLSAARRRAMGLWCEDLHAAAEECFLADLHRVGLQFLLQSQRHFASEGFRDVCRVL